MEKSRIIIVAALLIAAVMPAKAYWKVVIDPYCTATVMANLASQKVIEDQHNKRLDSIASKKQKLELYTLSMATIKELYKLTMENVSGFGTESKYYAEIGNEAYDILTGIPTLIKTVSKAKFRNQVLCYGELSSLVMETQQLVADFVNIVNNAKVENPLGNKANTEKKSDGYNLLDRYERLTLANTIYTHLRTIRYKVEGLKAMAQYATLQDMFFSIDPEGWANVVTMRNNVDGLVMSWNRGLI